VSGRLPPGRPTNSPSATPTDRPSSSISRRRTIRASSSRASARWRKSVAASRAAAPPKLPPAPADVGAGRPTTTPNLPPPELVRAVAERVPGVVALGGSARVAEQGGERPARAPPPLWPSVPPRQRPRVRTIAAGESVGPAGRDDRQAVGRPGRRRPLRVEHEAAAATPPRGRWRRKTPPPTGRSHGRPAV